MDGQVVGTGRVLGVFRKPHPEPDDIRKWPEPWVEVGPDGVVGDYHAGPYKRHPRVDPTRPNLRQLTIVSQELLDWVASTLGVRLQPGDLGENVLVEGLGDLTAVSSGDLLVFEGGAVLVVTGPNAPCHKVNRYHPALREHLVGRRGLTARVYRTGRIGVGDAVLWVRAPAGDGGPAGPGGS
ncbi:Putative metal-sulfur cluster biosynthesis proteins YuaD [bacterium HR11]|nr:Putative metal-sulfur cluster biosynthesis proteins YuaD [bacterium HR11]